MRDASASQPDAAEPGEPDAVHEAGREGDGAGGLAAAVARSRAIGLDGTFGPVERDDDAGLWLAPGTHEPEAPEGTVTPGESAPESAGDRQARAAILAKAPLLGSITVDPPRPVVLSAPAEDEMDAGRGADEGVTGNDVPGRREPGSAFRRGGSPLDETGPVPPLPAIPESIRVPEGVTLPPGISLPQGATVFDGPVRIASPLLDPEAEAPAGEPGRHRAHPGKHARVASEQSEGAGSAGVAESTGVTDAAQRSEHADETAGEAAAASSPGEPPQAAQPPGAAASVQSQASARTAAPAQIAPPSWSGQERAEPVPEEQRPAGGAAHASAAGDPAANAGPLRDEADHGEADPDPELLRDTAELPDPDALAAQDAIAAREAAQWAPDLRADEEAGRGPLTHAPEPGAARGEPAPGSDVVARHEGKPPVAAAANAGPEAVTGPGSAAGLNVAGRPDAADGSDAPAGPVNIAGVNAAAGPDPIGEGTAAAEQGGGGHAPDEAPESRLVPHADATRDISAGKRTIEVDARDPAGEDARQLLFPAEGDEARAGAAGPVRVRNAGFAFIIGLGGSAVFAALYLAAFAFLRALFTGQGDALRWAIAYTPTAPFWLPVAGFGALFLLWGLISNRSRWGSYIVGGLLAGVAGFLLYHCGVAVQRMLNGEGPLGNPLVSLADEAHLLGALVSAIVARETFTWFGGLIAARARWLRRRARRGERS